MDWSKWQKFSEETVSSVPQRPGVYMIRCLEAHGKPMKIHRAAGLDEQGIISIGVSSNLKNRLSGFFRTIQPGVKRSNHAAGWYFVSFGYDRLFPVTSLEFSYVLTRTEEEALRKEFSLLARYRAQFLDMPPLNNSPGRYPDDWKKVMREITGRDALDD